MRVELNQADTVVSNEHIKPQLMSAYLPSTPTLICSVFLAEGCDTLCSANVA